MDDKGQVSLEYMIIISILIGIAAMVSLVAGNFFGLKKSIVEINNNYKYNLDKMWEVKEGTI